MNHTLLRTFVAIVLLTLTGVAASARTKAYTGKVSTYPIVVYLDFHEDNTLTGKFAYKDVLDRMGDKETSWLNIKSNTFQYTPGIIGGRSWRCEVTNYSGKVVEYWLVEDNPSTEASPNLNVIVTRNGVEYNIILKPKR